MQPEHIGSPDPNILPTKITDTGALAAYSGQRTGRSPKDKRVVLDETTKDVRYHLLILTIFRLYGGAMWTCQSHPKVMQETDRESSIFLTQDQE